MRHHLSKTAITCAALLLAAGAPGCGDGGGQDVTGPAAAGLPALTIQEVVLQVEGPPAVLLLRPDGRVVFLPVDACTADLIYARLHAVPLPRPTAPDLFRSIATALDLTVPRVVLDLGEQDSVVARIAVRGSQVDAELPARAGDALAVAQRLEAAILATPRLLHQYALGATAGRLLGESHSARPPSSVEPPVLPPAAKGAVPPLLTPGDPVQMRVFAVVQPLLGSLEIALIDPAGSVVLPLYVVACQGAAVHAGLHGLELPEVQPYELLRRLLECGQAQMTRAAVTRLDGGIFIGEIDLARSGQSLAIDARPSDAIALALRVGAPVYVARALLEQYGEDPAPYRQLLDQPAAGS